MNRSILFRFIMALVLVAAILGLGAYAYKAGMAQGIAISAQPAASETGQAVMPHFPMVYGHPFYGFGGFGFLGCLVPFFLLCLVFFAFRAVFWGGPRHWGNMHHGSWGRGEAGQGPPTLFTEWHRQAHAQPPSGTDEK